MAKKSVPKTASKSKPLKGKKWSELKPGTQKKYKAAGVTPAKFNAWRRPEVRAKAKREGKQRWEVIGLPSKHKVSGQSSESAFAQAVRAFREAYQDRPKYREAGVRQYLRDLQEEEGLDRIREIAKMKPPEVWANTFPKVSRDQSFHYH